MMTNNKTRQGIAVVISALLMSACTPVVRDTNVRDDMQNAFEIKEQAPAPATPPAEVSAALLPPVQVHLPGVNPDAEIEQRFDVKVRHVRARDFFLSLVENTPYNMIVHHNVSGYISLDLKNVTLPEVLNIVRNVNGYDYKLNGKNVEVFPNTIHTRIYHVDYLAMKRTGQSVITSKTGQISVSGSSASGDSTTTGTTSSNSSSISTVTDADFWADLKESLQTLIGTADGRKVSVNPQTGMVMVRAMPSELRVVEDYLNESQNIVQRQVILEARILEVLLDDGFQSGINWAGLQQDGSDTLTGAQIGGGTIFSGSNISNIYGNAGNLDPLSPSAIEGATTSAFGGVFTLALNTSDFTAFIELLKRQGDVQVLSSPRVSTINNQKAVIKVGSDEFYVTNVNTDTTTTAGTGNTNLSVELDPFFSGVALDVTPQISQAGEIVLHIHPAVSDVSEQTKTITTTLGTLSLPLAASNIRESDTIIRAANQQVVVIGGLMQNTTQDQVASVPLLGDLPLIGGLFRHTKKTSRKSELVILLKPTVVDANGNIWHQQLQRSSSSIRSMSEGM